jgi:hypothetical protein
MIAIQNDADKALKALKSDLTDLEFLLGRLSREANKMARDLQNFNHSRNYGLTLNLMQSQLDAIREQIEICRESDKAFCKVETQVACY